MEAGSSLTPASFDTGIVVGDGARFGLGGAGLTLCGGTERWRASAGARTSADLERRACQRGGQSRAEAPRGPGCGLWAAGCWLLAVVCWRDERARCGEGGNGREGGSGGGRWRRSRSFWSLGVLESGVWRPSFPVELSY